MRDMTEPLDTYDDQGDYDWDDDEVEDRGPRPRILWGRVISLIVFMLIAFFIGRWSKPGGVSQEEFDAVVAEQEALQDENAELEQQVTDLNAMIENTEPGGEQTGDTGDTETGDETEGGEEVLTGEEYTVQSGDTLSRIVKRERGCLVVENAEGQSSSLVDNVIDADTQQPVDPNVPIAVGQVLIIPPIPPGYSCPGN
jgi:hypothetical protein